MPSLNAIRLSFVSLGVLLLTEVVVHAQTQGMRAFENRLEGTNVHTNALQDFTLIALHRSFQTFPRDSVLHVRFFLPRSVDNQPRQVFVNAVELQDTFHYLMQAKKNNSWKEESWNIFEPWPTRDVIDGLGIEPTNLGVLAAYRRGSEQPVYLPADVYPHLGASSSAIYTFHFITGQSLQSLEVTVTNSRGMPAKLPKLQLKCNRTFNTNCKLYAAGSSQSFPLDLTSLPEGEYHVKLLGHIPGALTPTSLDISIYHRP